MPFSHQLDSYFPLWEGCIILADAPHSAVFFRHNIMSAVEHAMMLGRAADQLMIRLFCGFDYGQKGSFCVGSK